MPSTSDEMTWRDLDPSDPDRSLRASDAIFESGRGADVLQQEDAAKAVIRLVESGVRSASGILLLGYTEAGRPVLEGLLREHGQEPVKLKSWSRPVPLEIVARNALSRLGDRAARTELLHHVAEYDSAIRVFLLDILPYQDAPELWHAESEYLQDTSEIPEDVPSGADRRRVCDHAVDAFLGNFQFPVPFQARPGGRYKPEEIEQIKQHLVDTVPR